LLQYISNLLKAELAGSSLASPHFKHLLKAELAFEETGGDSNKVNLSYALADRSRLTALHHLLATSSGMCRNLQPCTKTPKYYLR